ncbi:T9SS type A sorting domain-containing protein [Psychroserpens burtonensis]|uniref:T9SS type A sorting domain-containing protein n=1 Tax=Psychroserpens burtonensis TaxID=49278 RepID=UPI0006886B07|nr:T9SS type A sorting domain-containing protein [Psychroserpens burtonensis]
MKLKLLSLFTIISACALMNAQTTFEPKVTIDSDTGDNPYTMATGLIDDDAFLDIIVGTDVDNTLIWYKNNGDETFTKQTNTPNTMAGVGGLKLVDLNNDTFVDILITAYSSDFVAWYANDGLGNFGTEQIIATVLGASGLFVGDIDGDTTPDVAVTSYDNNEVVWFANNGSGVFGTANLIDNTLSSPGAVNMKDIDGDGDLDALVATAVYDGNDVVKIFTNNFVPSGTVSFADDMPTVATGKTGIFNATFEDLDGDADLDILVTEISCGGCVVGNLYWYEDNGSGFTETTFTTSIINPSVAQHQDLDNDGLKDIILSSGSSGAGNDIVWFKNNGGTYGSEQIIDATSSQAFVYNVADYDVDGDLDIVSCAYNQDQLNYFENLRVSKTNALILTGVFDGSLAGGTPKGVEIFVTENIPDLSVFGLGSANNGGGSDGQEFTFPAVAATTGEYIYISSEDPQFAAFFGQPADYTSTAMGINGDDAVELFENGVVIDTYGDINTNGDGEVWDYTDGWAYRVDVTGPDGATFVPGNWTYSGINELEGGTDNASASTPFPIGTYAATLSITNVNSTASFSMYPNPNNSGIININTYYTGDMKLEIFDALGKSILSEKLTNNTVDISALSPGLYHVSLTQNNVITNKKLIVY